MELLLEVNRTVIHSVAGEFVIELQQILCLLLSSIYKYKYMYILWIMHRPTNIGPIFVKVKIPQVI